MRHSPLNIFLRGIIITGIICSASLRTCAQPAYIDVLSHFFKKYDHTVPGLLYFEKRRDGWYVTTRNEQQPEKIETKALYWSATKNSYLPLTGFLNKTERTDERIKTYLADGQHSGDWYNYERCRYFGYNEWQDDVVADFKDYNSDNDTLLESLARAYGYVVHTYLWYQQGGVNTFNNPLREPLKPDEPVARERMDSAVKYMNAGVSVYQKLAARTPAYACLVGAATSKYNNEQFHAWSLLRFCGYDAEAEKYLASIHPDTAIVVNACNLLRSCPQNAILFTYGDNDTYYSWYVQEKLGFRKDVSVVNTSLLGVPRYIDYLKRKSVVAFSASAAQYQHPGNQLTYLMSDEQATDNIRDVRTLVSKALARQGEPAIENYEYLRYDVSGPTLPVSLAPGGRSQFPSELRLTDSLSIATGQYLYLNQLLMLDMVCSNINTRPILFNHDEDRLFGSSYLRHGVTDRVVPINGEGASDTAFSTAEYKYFRQYMEDKYVTPPPSKNPDIASRMIDYVLLRNQSLVIKYAQNNKLPGLARTYFEKAQLTAERLGDDYYTAYCLMVPLLRDGKKAEAVRMAEKLAQTVYERYKHPSALNGYVTRRDLLETLTSINTQLSPFDAGSTKLKQLEKQLKALP